MLRRLVTENSNILLLKKPTDTYRGHYIFTTVWAALHDHQFKLDRHISDIDLSTYFENMGLFIGLQDVLAREVSCGQASSELARFPHSWQLEPPEILNKDGNIALFKKFIDFLQSINEKTDKFHQRNIDLLLDTHGESIFHLINILGEERALNYLKSKVFKNLVKLETLLIQLSSIGFVEELCHSNFESFPSSVKDDPYQIETFVQYAILRASSAVQAAKLVDENDLWANEIGKQLSEAIKINDEAGISLKATPDILLKNLINTLLNEIICDKEHGEFDNEKIFQFIEKHSIHRLFQLLEAANHMASHDNYRAIFLALVKCDLMGEDVDKFLHDTVQQNKLGSAIAAHNDKIRKGLVSYGVDPQSALEYSGRYQFLVEPSGATSILDNLYSLLWGHIKQLELAARDLKANGTTSGKNGSRLSGIIRNIDQLEKNIQARVKSGENKLAAIHAVLTQEVNIKLISKITGSFAAVNFDLHKLTSDESTSSNISRVCSAYY